MSNYVAYNRFYKTSFCTFIFAVFSPLYAEIRCLQHSVTYHGRVSVCLYFLLKW